MLAPMLHHDIEGSTVRLQMRPVIDLSEDEFFEFCQLNRKLRLERTAEGEILIMAPAGVEAGAANAELVGQVRDWAKRDGKGVVFDSSSGFTLLNGATRSPDASWVERSRLAKLSTEQKRKFLPLSPDFVVELRSPSDRLASLQEKLEEYVANGTRLAWLIDLETDRVYVYRPGADVECVGDPSSLSADPPLQGLTLDLQPIWNPGL
jgi:Uma2 family endonuclease